MMVKSKIIGMNEHWIYPDGLWLLSSVQGLDEIIWCEFCFNLAFQCKNLGSGNHIQATPHGRTAGVYAFIVSRFAGTVL